MTHSMLTAAEERYGQVPARPWSGGGTTALDLARNELVHAGAAQLIQTTLAALPASLAMRYPAYRGAGDALAALLAVPAEELTLAAGGDAAIQHICQLLGPHSAGVLSATPNYAAWDVYTALYGIPIERVPACAPGGDEKFLARVAALDRRIVTLASPESIWGREASDDVIDRLSELAAERGHLLVIDDCYTFFRHGPRPLLRRTAGAIHLVSCSKGFGLAGGRLAAVVGDPAVLRILRRNRLEGPLSALTLGLTCGLLAPGNHMAWRRVWADVRAQRATVARMASAALPTWRVVTGGGNFVTLRSPSAEAREWLLTRADAGRVRIADLAEKFGIANAIRITVGDQSVTKTICELIGGAAVPGADRNDGDDITRH